MTDELKPCPFCGESEDLEDYIFDDFVDNPPDLCVRCQDCGALGPSCSMWAVAKDAWNERAAD